ncbi:hypothetical protein EXN66_Car005905 [Channa argus]|uniref:Uncharacterized protein n=1 Tax=Channa argus TaxID=215402 RepID=A0A6G1PJ56_CHAAH|nr:hypothetical protein EXN66_Car005905 [Channa argus]
MSVVSYPHTMVDLQGQSQAEMEGNKKMGSGKISLRNESKLINLYNTGDGYKKYCKVFGDTSTEGRLKLSW